MNSPEIKQAPKVLSIREKAIISAVWIITHEERNRLDRFFLMHDTWDGLKTDLIRNDNEQSWFLQENGQQYKVVFMEPLTKIQEAKKLGLSFRQCRKVQFAVVLIKSWAETTEDENSSEPTGEQRG